MRISYDSMEPDLKKNKTPCVDLCRFEGQKGWCLGCGRTRRECQEWKSLKPYARKQLEAELKRRLVQLKEVSAQG